MLFIVVIIILALSNLFIKLNIEFVENIGTSPERIKVLVFVYLINSLIQH